MATKKDIKRAFEEGSNDRFEKNPYKEEPLRTAYNDGSDDQYFYLSCEDNYNECWT